MADPMDELRKKKAQATLDASSDLMARMQAMLADDDDAFDDFGTGSSDSPADGTEPEEPQPSTPPAVAKLAAKPASKKSAAGVPVGKLKPGAKPPPGAKPISKLPPGAKPVAKPPPGAKPVSKLPPGAKPVAKPPPGAKAVAKLPAGAKPVAKKPAAAVAKPAAAAGKLKPAAATEPAPEPEAIDSALDELESLMDDEFGGDADSGSATASGTTTTATSGGWGTDEDYSAAARPSSATTRDSDEEARFEMDALLALDESALSERYVELQEKMMEVMNQILEGCDDEQEELLMLRKAKLSIWLERVQDAEIEVKAGRGKSAGGARGGGKLTSQLAGLLGSDDDDAYRSHTTGSPRSAASTDGDLNDTKRLTAVLKGMVSRGDPLLDELRDEGVAVDAHSWSDEELESRPDICVTCRKRVNEPSDSPLVLQALERLWHRECWKCADCGLKMIPGDPFGADGLKLLCEKDYMRKFVCPQCEDVIDADVEEYDNKVFHPDCLILWLRAESQRALDAAEAEAREQEAYASWLDTFGKPSTSKPAAAPMDDAAAKRAAEDWAETPDMGTDTSLSTDSAGKLGGSADSSSGTRAASASTAIKGKPLPAAPGGRNSPARDSNVGTERRGSEATTFSGRASGSGSTSGRPTVPINSNSVWKQYLTPEGRTAYYNNQTKKTQWTKPPELMTEAERAAAAATAASTPSVQVTAAPSTPTSASIAAGARSASNSSSSPVGLPTKAGAPSPRGFDALLSASTSLMDARGSGASMKSVPANLPTPIAQLEKEAEFERHRKRIEEANAAMMTLKRVADAGPKKKRGWFK